MFDLLLGYSLYQLHGMLNEFWLIWQKQLSYKKDNFRNLYHSHYHFYSFDILKDILLREGAKKQKLVVDMSAKF